MNTPARTTASRTAASRDRGDDGFTLLELLVTAVILLTVLGIVGRIFADSDRVYRTQRQYVDARGGAASALEMIVRLIRQAGESNAANGIWPDPDGNGTLDSIRLVADWNPRNGVWTDPYEDVTFTVAGGTLFKREPADAGPVAFADRVNSITFSYTSPGGVPVANPAAVPKAHLGYVNVTLQSTPVNNVAGRVFTSSASVRRRE
jgi:prepilin-type N-terminal cleavage/methylation domain-containing protein